MLYTTVCHQLLHTPQVPKKVRLLRQADRRLRWMVFRVETARDVGEEDESRQDK